MPRVPHGLQHELWDSSDIDRRGVWRLGVRMTEKGNGIVWQELRLVFVCLLVNRVLCLNVDIVESKETYFFPKNLPLNVKCFL